MRAINLIPAEQQRGASGAAGRSGGGVYILLTALALIVVMAAAYVVTNKSVGDKRAQLTRVTAQAQAAEARAASLTSYTKFAAIRSKRVDTVTQLAASRFDWAHALREVARVIPKNAWLTTMTGTTSPTVTLSGGTSGALRSSLDVPAITIQGCTTSQASVAKIMSRLRLIDGVQQVSLEDSSKADSSGGSGGASSGDCRGGHEHFPLFSVDVFYQPSATPPPAATGGTQTAAAISPASSSTPATTTSPSSTSSTVPSSGGTTP